MGGFWPAIVFKMMFLRKESNFRKNLPYPEHLRMAVTSLVTQVFADLLNWKVCSRLSEGEVRTLESIVDATLEILQVPNDRRLNSKIIRNVRVIVVKYFEEKYLVDIHERLQNGSETFIEEFAYKLRIQIRRVVREFYML